MDNRVYILKSGACRKSMSGIGTLFCFDKVGVVYFDFRKIQILSTHSFVVVCSFCRLRSLYIAMVVGQCFHYLSTSYSINFVWEYGLIFMVRLFLPYSITNNKVNTKNLLQFQVKIIARNVCTHLTSPSIKFVRVVI